MESQSTPAYLAYFQRLLQLDRQGALSLVNAYLAEHSGDIVRLYNEVLMPALIHAGAEWEADRISVAHEHYISEVTRDLIFRLGPLLWESVNPGDNPPVAVTCAAPDERHVLGLLMVGDILRASGLIVHPLGEGAPARAVADFTAQLGANLLAISIALPEHFPQAAELIELARKASPRLLVLAGGNALRSHPDAPSTLGADFWASDIEGLRGLLPELLNRLRAPNP